MMARDCEIPAPWGHIAAKTFGNESDEAILLIHGIIDNAASFERLVERLPGCFFYISFDLPGHGRSSHFPAGLPIYSINYVYACKIVMDHYKKESYAILSHSYGAIIAMLLAMTCPSKVSKLVMLDPYLIPVAASCAKEIMYHMFEDFHATHEGKKDNDACFTYGQALEKVRRQRLLGELNEEAAGRLLSRSLETVHGGKFRFTWDRRLKINTFPFLDERYYCEMIRASPLGCPVLLILYEGSADVHRWLKPILDEIVAKEDCTLKVVKGDHYVHSNAPDVVAEDVGRFLMGKNSKL